jgi:hypothetical protein
MDNRQQDQAFKENLKHVAFAEGADAAFDMLVQEGWTVPGEGNGSCPEGFWIFALASWQRRVLMRDSDGSFWAMEMKT